MQSVLGLISNIDTGSDLPITMHQARQILHLYIMYIYYVIMMRLWAWHRLYIVHSEDEITDDGDSIQFSGKG